MPSLNDADTWVHGIFGANPASYPPRGAAPDPWAGTAPAQPAAKPAPSPLPQPMMADCKPVHGKVRGPENHLLCAKHGHILDVTAKTIIAHDMADYRKRQTVAHVAGAAAPVVDAVGKVLHAIPGVPPAANGHDAAPSGPDAKADPPKDPAAPTQEDKNRAYDAGIMLSITNTVADYLHAQYTDLVEGVDDTVRQWSDTIDKLKEAAPKEPSGLLSQLGSALFAATTVIFPELMLVKVAMKVKDISDKVDAAKAGDEQAAAATATKALFESKMQAKAALAAFSKEVRTELRGVRGKLVERVRAAIKTANKPPDFYEQVANDIEGYVGKFAVETLGIKIGRDVDPGAVQAVQAKLGAAIGTWLKQQYIQEHVGEKLEKIDIMFVMKERFMPPDIKAADAKKYLEDNPEIHAKLQKELGEDYFDEFRKKVWGEKD